MWRCARKKKKLSPAFGRNGNKARVGVGGGGGVGGEGEGEGGGGGLRLFYGPTAAMISTSLRKLNVDAGRPIRPGIDPLGAPTGLNWVFIPVFFYSVFQARRSTFHWLLSARLVVFLDLLSSLVLLSRIHFY